MYVLVAIVRKRLGLEASLYQILQILSLTLFEKMPILCVLQAIHQNANFARNARSRLPEFIISETQRFPCPKKLPNPGARGPKRSNIRRLQRAPIAARLVPTARR